MFFNSHLFIFAFVPAVLIGYVISGRTGGRDAAVLWLIAASIVFYSWWNPACTVLLTLSIIVNYGFVVAIEHDKDKKSNKSFALVALGIATNLFLLGYFKYFNFFVENINIVFGTDFVFRNILLPLGISFFTFQQIIFITKIYRGEIRNRGFRDYCFYITFFPKLISGPIVYPEEIRSQLKGLTAGRLRSEDISVGLTIFTIGLFKKAVLADGMARIADPVFKTAAGGASLTFFEGWCGTLAFTLQILFDFSGYTDMAIGVARLFGIRLPPNFNAPYRASNFIDFWRRWHITLSRFLRDFLYIPLGGNRRGEARKYFNLMVTMLLCGFWHGAGWTFIVWGGLHGVYSIINHAWRSFMEKRGIRINRWSGLQRFISIAMTFLLASLTWVFFRAGNWSEATEVFRAVSGANGITLAPELAGVAGPLARYFTFAGFTYNTQLAPVPTSISIILLLFVAWFFPSSQRLLDGFAPVIDQRRNSETRLLQWKPTIGWALVTAFLGTYSLLSLFKISSFIYFQF